MLDYSDEAVNTTVIIPFHRMLTLPVVCRCREADLAEDATLSLSDMPTWERGVLWNALGSCGQLVTM